MEISIEPIKKLLLDGVGDLTKLHFEEIGTYKDDMPLDIDWDKYLKQEANNIFRVFSARIDGKLVGYASTAIVSSAQYKGKLNGVIHDLFIKKDKRSFKLIQNLFKYVEDTLKSIGCSQIIVFEPHVSSKKNVGRLYKYLGYNPDEVVWVKVLGDNNG